LSTERPLICFLADQRRWFQTWRRHVPLVYSSIGGGTEGGCCELPTTEEAVKSMLKLADVKSSDIVYDLGCGDGRIVIAAAKEYGAHGAGIDINPVRIADAKENAKKAGVENLVRFEENDLFDADIHEGTVVTCSCSIASTRNFVPSC